MNWQSEPAKTYSTAKDAKGAKEDQNQHLTAEAAEKRRGKAQSRIDFV
jgi:hypothetical protein